MDISVRGFYELSLDELYAILRIRSEVFVVEQNSVYLDPDGFDQKAVHMIGREDGRIVGILRILPPGNTFEEAAIGRIISVERGRGVGTAMVGAAIDYIRDVMHEDVIRIEAQTQAMPFYEKLGFVADSDVFYDGGIPHREMVLRL